MIKQPFFSSSLVVSGAAAAFDDSGSAATAPMEFSFLRRAIIAATRSLRRALKACVEGGQVVFSNGRV